MTRVDCTGSPCPCREKHHLTECLHEKNFLLRKRLHLSLLIWFGNVLLWVVISIIKGISINEARSPSVMFWILFLSVYTIQALPYWLFLNRNFVDKRVSNIVLMVSMPFMILVRLWVFFLFGGSFSPTGGSFK